MGGNSPNDVLSDDDDENGQHLHISNEDDDGPTSPHRSSASDYNNNQASNPSNCFSPSMQTRMNNGLDDLSTSNAVKNEQENEYHCLSPSSPSIQTLPTKISASSSSTASKRLTGTLNRLLHSAINRPNGHHYHHQTNGVSSSPSASTTTALIDSTTKEPKISLEMSTQAIESTFFTPLNPFHSIILFSSLAFVQHFDSSFNTMTYFQEKLQQLLVSIARKRIHLCFPYEKQLFFFSEERDTYRTLYLKEHDRRLAAELRLKENSNSLV